MNKKISLKCCYNGLRKITVGVWWQLKCKNKDDEWMYWRDDEIKTANPGYELGSMHF